MKRGHTVRNEDRQVDSVALAAAQADADKAVAEAKKRLGL